MGCAKMHTDQYQCDPHGIRARQGGKKQLRLSFQGRRKPLWKDETVPVFLFVGCSRDRMPSAARGGEGTNNEPEESQRGEEESRSKVEEPARFGCMDTTAQRTEDSFGGSQKPKRWFSDRVQEATGGAAENIVFTPELLSAISPEICQCRTARQDVWDAMDGHILSEIEGDSFRRLAEETDFHFDSSKYNHALSCDGDCMSLRAFPES
jgi:hypothetical protein